MGILNDNIKKARSNANMTLEELAVKVGVSKQTIQKYESGVISNIPSDKIEKLAEALEVSPAYLMGWEEIGTDNVVVYDQETLELLDTLRSRPDMQMLFSVSKDATTEDIMKTVKIIEALKDNK